MMECELQEMIGQISGSEMSAVPLVESTVHSTESNDAVLDWLMLMCRLEDLAFPEG